MAFTVKLAEKVIRVKNIYPELETFLQQYAVEDATADFTISLSEDDIAREENETSEQSFSPAYLETLALLRKISDILPRHRRFLMHGASISYEGKAYLFTAPSGTGKSTHIRLWKKYLGEKVKIVNGDKPFISLDKDENGNVLPIIYGTPWAGKEHWHRNCSESLCGICFVERGMENSIRRLAPEECLMKLFHQVYLPEDADTVGLTLELVDLLLKNVPLYLLTCDISEAAVRCSFEEMTGLPYPVI